MTVSDPFKTLEGSVVLKDGITRRLRFPLSAVVRFDLNLRRMGSGLATIPGIRLLCLYQAGLWEDADRRGEFLDIGTLREIFPVAPEEVEALASMGWMLFAASIGLRDVKEPKSQESADWMQEAQAISTRLNLSFKEIGKLTVLELRLRCEGKRKEQLEQMKFAASMVANLMNVSGREPRRKPYTVDELLGLKNGEPAPEQQRQSVEDLVAEAKQKNRTYADYQRDHGLEVTHSAGGTANSASPDTK